MATMFEAPETRIFSTCFDVFRPPPDRPMLAWACEKIKTEDGRPFDHWLSPHLGAPGGPMEAFLDPLVREIYLMFGARLVKTTFALMALIYSSSEVPSSCFFASATKKLVEDVVGDRAWKMIAASGLFERLPPENRRAKTKVRLPRNRWDTGWAESPTTLADKSAKILHGNELGKWRYTQGTNEAHPWQLAKMRTQEHPDRKIIGEGTPTVKRRCRLEAEYLRGWQCRYYVPCPKCRFYQRLNLGKGEAGGIRWDRAPSGRHDVRLAKRSGRFVCANGACEAELRNDVRAWMMRHGVWVPEGCTIDHAAAWALFDGLPEFGTHHDHPTRPYAWEGWKSASWIEGTPVSGGLEVASYQMSSIYSLSQFGWGDIAEERVKAFANRDILRNFTNSIMGETWEEQRNVEEWEIVARRMMGDAETMPERVYKRGIVPKGFALLGLGVDRQIDHYVWHLVGAARPKRWATIDYGTTETLDEIYETVLAAKFEHADGGEPLYVRRALIDTGYDPVEDDQDTIHQWARRATAKLQRLRRATLVYGCKGSSTPLGQPYRPMVLGKDSTCPGARYYQIDPDFTQGMIDRGLYGGAPEEAGGWLLFDAAVDEQEDFLRQMMNDGPEETLDPKTNQPRRRWKRTNENLPNDYRDAGRYALAALLGEIRGGAEVPVRAAKPAETAARPVAKEPTGLTTPDGRPWFVMNR